MDTLHKGDNDDNNSNKCIAVIILWNGIPFIYLNLSVTKEQGKVLTDLLTFFKNNVCPKK
jgi:hypothetical protein